MDPRDPSLIDPARPASSDAGDASRAPTPAARAMGEWLQQLTRALKTCRLYEATNPTVVSFRRDLATALAALLQEHGAIEIGFTPEQIHVGETPVYAARSREDNLSLPFFRDGIRAMALQPGVAPREVDALLDAMLQVTRLGREDADLVTLLWEKELEHVSIQYVSTEGDVESGGDATPEGATATGPIAPWPERGAVATGPSAGGAAGTDEGHVDDTGRSDDRLTAGRAREVEAALMRLQINSDEECERFRGQHVAESAAPLARRMLDLMIACFGCARDGDRDDLRQFLPRLLHDSVSNGDWNEARECLYLLRDPTGERDPIGAFVRDVSRPDSLTSRNAWRCLDRQAPEQQETFFEFARELGVDATEWLMFGIAESQRQALRRGLARTLATLAADNPERLAPWLDDQRWYVVRNVVHILGQMTGASSVGLLRAVAKHPEFRVRREVVNALAQVPREQSRPLLLEMLEAADPRLSPTILHQLADVKDPELANRLFQKIDSNTFAERSEAEQRALYQALAAVGGDGVVPLLEPHVLQGNWLQRGNETQRMAAVMCLARIGTPAARAILERGAQSRRREVARACETGLASIRPDREGSA